MSDDTAKKLLTSLLSRVKNRPEKAMTTEDLYDLLANVAVDVFDEWPEKCWRCTTPEETVIYLGDKCPRCCAP